jgi:hypothetical protein
MAIHRFLNLDGSGPQPFKNVVKWGVTDRLSGRRRRSPGRAPMPYVAPNLAAIATPLAAGRGVRFTWLGPDERLHVLPIGGDG